MPAASDTDIDEIETRAAAANKTIQGADYGAIMWAVANERDIPIEDLRQACLERWAGGY